MGCYGYCTWGVFDKTVQNPPYTGLDNRLPWVTFRAGTRGGQEGGGCPGHSEIM